MNKISNGSHRLLIIKLFLPAHFIDPTAGVQIPPGPHVNSSVVPTKLVPSSQLTLHFAP